MLHLITTVDLEYSSFTIIQVLASESLISLPSTHIAIFEAKLVLGSTVIFAALIIPCVCFKYFVRSFFFMNSAIPATISIDGLLILAQQRHSLYKKHHALLEALTTLPINGAPE